MSPKVVGEWIEMVVVAVLVSLGVLVFFQALRWLVS